ncbi:hypothetical protein GN244_ATG16921 [Phytophthora infestans]|uniref:Uncharacterized protein n=1 Tax=Phytophthora infestans TaxID=4787 RepID=A0A833S9T5_PHYIN|nr:hypothetical protein GN244_ATG19941 [Phytophthora infestans]KAF4031277.1 hypothetical protein GN244_ATG16921 [Phytophthora infestans]KAF4127131.1 hypothetical protein GN958_ATG23677 [Phytophthora infestans]KAF4128099.1 hypothetical protein GN958_ATG22645 [Phytophthora infestans]KAF4132157.1 hypothetical protein GN958_ATG18654 [Phytophthora infestans]
MRPTAVILATSIGTAAHCIDAAADQYALGTLFIVEIDVDATSVEVVNSAGDQVWKCTYCRLWLAIVTSKY